MQKFATITLIGALLTGVGLSAAAHAQQSGESTTGYLVDARGLVAKSGTGLCWRTGYWTPAMAIRECDPGLIKVAETQSTTTQVAPPPPPPAPAPRPRFEKVVLNSEVLFDFNKATLKPGAFAELDKVVASIKDKDVQLVLITGHTDRIGSVSYNQKLSERRAAAVKDYFVSKGIAADRLQAVGKGKSQPVSTGCVGNRKTPKLVACLQPDRRVEIESNVQQPAR